MGEQSKIQWTDNTFNPWIGCTKVSQGCKFCYAENNTFTRRERSNGHELWGPKADRHVTSDANWAKPEAWNRAAETAGRRARVFCASLADVFEDHPVLGPARGRLFVLIEATPWLDWQLLTKRPENVMAMVPASWRDTFPRNVWLGTSVEDQAAADERIPHLLRCPAAVRFLSCEPLLGPVNLAKHLGNIVGYEFRPGISTSPERLTVRHGIGWVIAGGESGPGARPCDVAWLRSLRDQCAAAGVPYFLKQIGARPFTQTSEVFGRGRSEDRKAGGWWHHLRDRKGGDSSEWPEDLRVREFPEVRP